MDAFTAKETSKKYNHTFCNVFLKDQEKILPVYFERFNIGEGSQPSSAIMTFATFTNEHNKILGVSHNQQWQLNLNEFKILNAPYRKVFDCNGMTRVYTRNPQRQWQRGVTGGNSSFASPLNSIYQMLRSSKKYHVTDDRFRTNIGTLNGLLTDCFAGSLTAALFEIDKYKLLSRSINDKYFISLFPCNEKQYVLFRFHIPIAYYNRDKDRFTLINELYMQELQDFCRRNNIYSQIGN